MSAGRDRLVEGEVAPRSSQQEGTTRMPDRDKEALSRLEEFAAGRPGWRMHDDRGGVYAGRMFEYPRGQSALLSLKHVGRSHFAAQLNLPFSAGPEASHEDRFEACLDWAIRTERLLRVPLLLAETQSAEQERELVSSLKPSDLRLLCMVLDVDPGRATDLARQRIVQAVKGRG